MGVVDRASREFLHHITGTLTALGKYRSKYTLTTLSSVPISGEMPSKPMSCSQIAACHGAQCAQSAAIGHAVLVIRSARRVAQTMQKHTQVRGSVGLHQVI